MTTNNDHKISTFEDLNLKDSLIKSIYEYGFEYPSMIQIKAIPEVVKGDDIVVQSQSGTGKTATFVISVLQLIDETQNGVQGIIIMPTRELALQVYDVVKNLGDVQGIKPVLCIGGYDIRKSFNELENYPSIMVGTPGRICHMLDGDNVFLGLLKIFVMDEADELLNNDFRETMKTIIGYIPPFSQIALFSATMDKDTIDVTRNFLKNPKLVLLEAEQVTLDGIKQFKIYVDNYKMKYDVLNDIYEHFSINQSIIYVNNKKNLENVSRCLENFNTLIIHGKMDMNERRDVMKRFRKGESRILISTDLLSRGIDISQISVVINFDVPDRKDTYIHRIGRSGRFGRQGVAINICERRKSYILKDLELYYSTKIEPLPDSIEEYY